MTQRLRALRDGSPGVRVVFLRRSFEPVSAPSLYIARPSESVPSLHAWRLDGYDDLLELDLEALTSVGQGGPTAATAATAASAGGEAVDGALFLVCTHGRHDRCCARNGHPFYRRLVVGVGQSAWQSSHIGGDRFAANLAWFPWGVFYGRLEGADADRLLAACERGEVLLDRYRGRSCHPFHVQAAEYFVRRAWGELAVDGLRLLDARRIEGDGGARWRVRLAHRDGGRAAVVEVAREPSEFRIAPTCSALDSRPVPIHRLIDLAEEPVPETPT